MEINERQEGRRTWNTNTLLNTQVSYIADQTNKKRRN